LRIIGTPRVNVSSLVLLPGAFNPPTRAHVTLALAALSIADAVLFALPSVLPHKQFTGATLDQRIQMLTRIAKANDRFGAVVADGGLYIDIAREARMHFPGAKITLLCGRDAAERIVGWQYEEPDSIDRMLADFDLLVAARHGSYEPPERLRQAIRTFEAPNLDEYSSTRLRNLVKSGGGWRDLTPLEIAEIVEQIYSDCE
jgi:nicotinic acid mononucleotide adenylyltransferase